MLNKLIARTTARALAALPAIVISAVSTSAATLTTASGAGADADVN